MYIDEERGDHGGGAGGDNYRRARAAKESGEKKRKADIDDEEEEGAKRRKKRSLTVGMRIDYLFDVADGGQEWVPGKIVEFDKEKLKYVWNACEKDEDQRPLFFPADALIKQKGKIRLHVKNKNMYASDSKDVSFPMYVYDQDVSFVHKRHILVIHTYTHTHTHTYVYIYIHIVNSRTHLGQLPGVGRQQVLHRPIRVTKLSGLQPVSSRYSSVGLYYVYVTCI